MEYIYSGFLLIIVFISAFFYQKLIKSRNKPLIKILPLMLLLLIPLFYSINSHQQIDNNILQPIGDFAEKNTQIDKRSEKLEDIIQKELENANGTYAVAVKNLETGEYYYYNEQIELQTASLYKLWVMGAVFEEIERGNLSKAQNIGFQAETINESLDIESEYAEITEGFVGNTVEEALERMITISDNYSAHILYLTIGWSKVKNFLEKYNFNNSSADSLTTTASDILSYFEKLYDEKLVSNSSSSEMLEILKRQQLNDRIPKYLPENIEIAHKTGELDAVKHDAGIVFNSSNGDYIVVLLSKTDSQTKAAEIEAEISEKIWEYFNN